MHRTNSAQEILFIFAYSDVPGTCGNSAMAFSLQKKIKKNYTTWLKWMWKSHIRLLGAEPSLFQGRWNIYSKVQSKTFSRPKLCKERNDSRQYKALDLWQPCGTHRKAVIWMHHEGWYRQHYRTEPFEHEYCGQQWYEAQWNITDIRSHQGVNC